MTDVIQTSTEWLALREPEDARARSVELATAAASLVGDAPLLVHDLGSGTGSMMRWLAPQLPGPQTWVLHDWNADLVQRAGEGIPCDADGQPVSVRTSVRELGLVRADDLRGASLVTASALLDVLSSEEVHAIAAACIASGVPVLLSLSVTGEVRLDPGHPLDEAFRAAFNAHQRRSADGRRLLGPHAVAVARGVFLEAGWHVRPVETPWRLGQNEPQLLDAWFEGWVDAALEQNPELGREAGDYLGQRRAQLSDGVLSAVVRHRDMLAWPR
ncbi:MAG: SAM-dependent methyltransferase [Humibacter sp.]